VGEPVQEARQAQTSLGDRTRSEGEIGRLGHRVVQIGLVLDLFAPLARDDGKEVV
jgi:hypothetical protein